MRFSTVFVIFLSWAPIGISCLKTLQVLQASTRLCLVGSKAISRLSQRNRWQHRQGVCHCILLEMKARDCWSNSQSSFLLWVQGPLLWQIPLLLKPTGILNIFCHEISSSAPAWNSRLPLRSLWRQTQRSQKLCKWRQ